MNPTIVTKLNGKFKHVFLPKMSNQLPLTSQNISIEMEGLRIESWEDFDENQTNYHGHGDEWAIDSHLSGHLLEFQNIQTNYPISIHNPLETSNTHFAIETEIENEIDDMNNQLVRLAEAHHELNRARQELIRLLTNQSLEFSESSSGDQEMGRPHGVEFDHRDFNHTLDMNEDFDNFLDANGVELSKWEEAIEIEGYCGPKFGINGSCLDSNGDVILNLLQSDLNR